MSPIDREQLERDGFCMRPSLLSQAEVSRLIDLIERYVEGAGVRPTARRGGIRDVMEHVPELRAIADHRDVRKIVEDVLGIDAILVRSTLFDKTSGANWKVPWHQDVTIAVRKRAEVEGYGPWSMKEGVTHVQPPSSVLERMLTVRIHLDACPASNGALHVLTGSHTLGRINQNDAPTYADEAAGTTCEAGAGDALIMRTLLLHASYSSEEPRYRRVLHFDFAHGPLAAGLEWRFL